MEQSANFENIVYIYLCKNPTLIKVVEDRFFTNEYRQALFRVTKKFFQDFKDIPFDLDDPRMDQLQELAVRNTKDIITDRDASKEENIEEFLSNAEHIINTKIDRYTDKWLKETIEAWISFQNAQDGFMKAGEYFQQQDINPKNVRQVIDKCREIISRKTGVIIDEDRGVDFFDPEAHRQFAPENLVNTGYKHLNQWLSGQATGGLEPGTLTILVGESNVGKSIWLGNIAANIMMNGSNVLLVSLEMGTAKIYKRIGANLFDIDISQYSDISGNSERISTLMREFKEQCMSTAVPLGVLRTKKFTHASAPDIEAFAKTLQDELGIRFHAIIIDYMTELANAHGVTQEKMYMYHKMNTNDMYQMAGDNDWAVLTAHQLAPSSYGASAEDITLQSLGESRGIIHRTDNIIGIVQTPDMKQENRYELKNLKTRDGEFKNYRIGYKIDYTHMRITEIEGMLDPDMTFGSGFA